MSHVLALKDDGLSKSVHSVFWDISPGKVAIFFFLLCFFSHKQNDSSGRFFQFLDHFYFHQFISSKIFMAPGTNGYVLYSGMFIALVNVSFP